MNKILMLADGSQYTQSVCDHAAWAAARLGVPVEAAHALGRAADAGGDLAGALGADARDALLAELAELDSRQAKLAHQRGRVLLDAVKNRLLAAGAPDATTRLRNGDVLDAVTDLENDAALIVIGKRGESADFAKGHLGSNLERVARASRRPVLVASRAFKPIERFLIAYDGSPGAEKAVDAVVAGPLLRGAACRLLAAASAQSADAHARLSKAAERLRTAGFVVDASIEAGPPTDVIARALEKEGVGLLAMGAWGHSRLRALFIGSTTAEMVRCCKIPVMLFR